MQEWEELLVGFRAFHINICLKRRRHVDTIYKTVFILIPPVALKCLFYPFTYKQKTPNSILGGRDPFGVVRKNIWDLKVIFQIKREATFWKHFTITSIRHLHPHGNYSFIFYWSLKVSVPYFVNNEPASICHFVLGDSFGFIIWVPSVKFHGKPIKAGEWLMDINKPHISQPRVTTEL